MSGESGRRRLRALLRSAGVRSPGDVSIVEQAFVHESHAKEHGGDSNERMEFLGDSILGAITAGWLFQRFSEEPEGRLTVRKATIVNDGQLAHSARRLGFAQLVQLGIGMRNAGGADNTSILADAFEAFVAALYLRYGIEKARRFVVNEHIAQCDHPSDALLDAKTRLQHYAQEHFLATPTYENQNYGTPQQPEFSATVVVKEKPLGTGTGPSKKAAQQAAAEAALTALHVTDDVLKSRNTDPLFK
ncbi:MAG: ribonuclease III [Candidatus Eremiobacteraeota bacterium]|nr:ribonuclease III [Candidatus Eremiobacteraeota bacterium]